MNHIPYSVNLPLSPIRRLSPSPLFRVINNHLSLRFLANPSGDEPSCCTNVEGSFLLFYLSTVNTACTYLQSFCTKSSLNSSHNAMSSNPALSLATSKNVSSPAQIPSPFQSQSGSSLATESYTQRRSGGSGSFGSGSTIRSTPSTARNNQSYRKQHKGQRRPRLADEDAAAESVSRVHRLSMHVLPPFD